ncbi:MAG: tRNA pseudouridine(38-40) synthase TruA [Altibacter sp.]|uniref:tRNA pseudouridine(38-40) synthase TruA n=1 Tax=Altibacter sp. TaxID=2024823 RepID=UPI001E15217D|nr:tRNA pseudouridine(38-40) synthase TruA [Altibacter sp.]MBZ0328151.1 tRNA pseudouridine(38-40) synthase TruA [Altibacter sp.]
MRYFIEISYSGKNYHGWQIQPDAISVQEVLERTLSTLLRSEIKVTGAGRTDTGVHAKQLFAHFNAEEILDVQELIFRLNSFLPKDISVNDLFRVTDEAHARFDAVAREYQYVISLKKDPFREDFAYHLHQEPSVTLMNEAAAMLSSYKDFQCFSRSNTDVKTYYCTIQKAAWEQEESQLVFTIVADRFLRNMVRAIVGTLLDVGFEKISRQDFKDIIESKDRTKAGASAPAHGLYLTKVVYPETIKR